MNVSDALFAVFAGLFAVLLLASLAGAGLHLRVAGRGGSATIDNLNARVRAWWAMIIVIGLAIWAGRWGVIALFGFVSFQCLREYVSLTYTRRGDHLALVWSFFFFLPLQYYLIAIDWYGLFTILIPVYAFLLLPIVAVLGADTTRFLERAAKVQWGLMVCVYCVSHVPALLALDIPGFEGRNVLLIVFVVLIVQASDVFQYVWGKLLGRRKLAPAVSPSKTVEGLVGGVASATLVGAAMWWITPFSPLQAGAIALVINLAGFFGGLVLSAIKRDRGVKDWGYMVEGHGGMLDRVDSLSFAAPIFFHIVRYWWVP
ncbi:phosphatidate cytidylyltransferase [Ottowia sp.]|uniref:phosphatidate cytidylyltransferase n=1 Tax=Ottowia sp. TaxID=1898956 RepID=UPI002C093CBC|nr:phosphatidate cytidylyltransferase [Ottowia sp.]HNR84560.1 phosphatidate cytidylyltransferase [Ottowia sp.]